MTYATERKFETHIEETKAVKRALADVGILAKVHHGTSTSYRWLQIRVLNRLSVPHDKEKCGWAHCSENCEACAESQTLYSRTLDVAQIVTGRSGNHDDYIHVSINFWRKEKQP